MATTATKTRKTVPANPKAIPRYAWMILGLVLSYIIIYIPLSLLGSYQTVPSGRTRSPRDQAISDQEVWQPMGLRLIIFHDSDGSTRFADPSRAGGTYTNFGGYLFLPLITIDRWLIHRSRDALTPSSVLEADTEDAP